MKLIHICPVCGQPGIGVKEKAVRYNVVHSKKRITEKGEKWNICANTICNCSYFSNRHSFKTSDLVKPLFFKDRSDNVPICYCSDLTRGEIKEAVKNGCKKISEVQKYTRKNITGYCETRNPLGKCCRNVFLSTISNG